MKSKVNVGGAAPADLPKPTTYAQIDAQGRIPYSKTAPAPVIGDKATKTTVRGYGAATKGKSYIA
jgi:hypothetical protein